MKTQYIVPKMREETLLTSHIVCASGGADSLGINSNPSNGSGDAPRRYRPL